MPFLKRTVGFWSVPAVWSSDCCCGDLPVGSRWTTNAIDPGLAAGPHAATRKYPVFRGRHLHTVAGAGKRPSSVASEKPGRFLDARTSVQRLRRVCFSVCVSGVKRRAYGSSANRLSGIKRPPFWGYHGDRAGSYSVDFLASGAIL